MTEERALIIGSLRKFIEKYPNVCVEQLRFIPRVAELELQISEIDGKIFTIEELY